MLDIDKFFDNFENPLSWDKGNYCFSRDEKDMHPYSVVDLEDKLIIVHNVLGIDKKDIKLTLEKQSGIYYILIKGKTVDSITNKEYSISSKFAVDFNQLKLDKITSQLKNGLLYISIDKKEELPKLADTITITII